MLLALISMTFTACDEWNCIWDTPSHAPHAPHFYDLLGSWQSYRGGDEFGEYNIYGEDVVRFDFYSNFTGRFTFHSWTGKISYIDFEWEISGRYLYIWYDDGDYEDLYYEINEYGELVLSTTDSFYQYTIYCPAGVFYEQGKDIDTIQAKRFDLTTGERHKSAVNVRKKMEEK